MHSYDICILAHPADAAQAKRLAESIRAYRLPSGVAPAAASMGYRSILLEDGGQEFGPAVQAALDGCRQLIVLCSPDSRDYAPLNRALLYFEEKRGRQSIVAVIVRGEPVDAFPSFFIEEKTVRRILPDGSVEQRVETQEPVASDLRAETPRQAKAVLKYETVRIVASLLGLEPDALERRHAKRARRRLLSISAAAFAALAVIVTAIWSSYVRAKNEADAAAAMTERSNQVTARLVEELPRRFAGNQQALSYVQEIIDEAEAARDGEGA